MLKHSKINLFLAVIIVVSDSYGSEKVAGGVDRFAATGGEYCFVMSDLESGDLVRKEGDCDIQESPCSTFKIAISLMGFDAEILKNDEIPEFVYQDSYNTERDEWKCSHTPKTWIKNSCIWYSQVITSMLGMEKMKKYVSCFAYGNQDLSGNPGKNDGIRKSWLCSSLRISPLEQIEFLKKILQKILPVSDHAYEQTSKLLYVSDLAHNWKLYGKRGGGIWDGTGRSIGWFVGWVTKEQKTLVFACLVRSNSRDFLVNSLYAKEKVLNIFDKAL